MEVGVCNGTQPGGNVPAAICLRDTGSGAGDERLAAAFQSLPEDLWHVFRDEWEISAAPP